MVVYDRNSTLTIQGIASIQINQSQPQVAGPLMAEEADMKRNVVLAVMVGLILLGIGLPILACCSESEIYYLGRLIEGGNTTFSYQVECYDDPSISHVTFGLGNCAQCSDIISPYDECGYDPTTEIIGVKFEDGLSPGGVKIYNITLRGIWPEGIINAAIKAGNTYCTKVTTGPGCPSINQPPIAINDTYSVEAGSHIVISVPGVMVNDSDPDDSPDPLVAIKLTNPSYGNLSFNPNGSFTYTPTSCNVNTDSFAYKVSDGEDYSNVATVTITITDTTSPDITCPGNVTVECDAGVCYTTNVSLGTPITSDNCQVASVTNNAPSQFPLGETIVTWVVEDASGNTASCTQIVTVIDDQKPIIDVIGDVEIIVECGSHYNDLGARVNDNCCAGDLIVGGGTVNTLVPGQYIVTYDAPDCSGNWANQKTRTVWVVDTTNPIITDCPSDIFVNNDPGLCGAIVFWQEPSVTDSCCFDRLESNYSPGDYFPVDTTEIIYEAFDCAGNSSICSFNVTVSDTEDPTISAPKDLFIGTDPDSCSATEINLGTPTTDDNCQVASVLNDAPTTFRKGETIVTWTVFDIHGNSSTDTQKVTVGDNQGPEITCPPTANLLCGQSTHPNNTGWAATTDNCDPDPNITYINTGTDPVVRTWTATDSSGNSSTCIQRITETGCNQPPDAINDRKNTQQNVSVVIDVLDNDSDPDGDTIWLIEDRPSFYLNPFHGTVEIENDGWGNKLIRYTPEQDFCGWDSFFYRIVDEHGADDFAQVTINIECSEPSKPNDIDCQNQVIISEIAWAGSSASPEDEWVELRNLGPNPVNLDGWTLRWRPKEQNSLSDFVWRSVSLEGVIEASPQATLPCTKGAENHNPFIIDHQVQAQTHYYIVTPGLPENIVEESFWTMQRLSDLSISNLEADMVYGGHSTEVPIDFSDEGDVVELIGPDGTVDTANAYLSANPSWPGGSIENFATMERIDPMGPDQPWNWKTNQGLYSYGLNRHGLPIYASAGIRNELPIDWTILPAGIEEVNILSRGHWLSLAFPYQEEVFQRWYGATPLNTFTDESLILVRGGIAFKTTNFPIGPSQIWVVTKPGYTIVIPLEMR